MNQLMPTQEALTVIKKMHGAFTGGNGNDHIRIIQAIASIEIALTPVPPTPAPPVPTPATVDAPSTQ